MRPIVLIIGHGSRDASANREFTELVDRYQSRRPELDIRHAYLELAQPALGDVLEQLPAEAGTVVVLPLFLFAAGHVKRDVPEFLAAAQRRLPAVEFQVVREIGVEPKMVNVLLERIATVQLVDPRRNSRTTLLMVGRGASDPQAGEDFRAMAALLQQAGGYPAVISAFMAMASPRLAEGLELAAAAGNDHILVVPYFLFAGELVAKLGQQVADFRLLQKQLTTTLAPHLGVTEQLLKILDERIAAATKHQTKSPGPAATPTSN